MRVEIRFGGFGGQGIVTAGFIVGKAALFDGKNAVMTQVYGPESRGARVSSDVIISDEEIDYPKVTKPDVLVLMSQEAYHVFASNAKEGTIIIDEDLVTIENDHGQAKIYKVKANSMAERLGRRIVANIVILGALTSITKITTKEAMKKAILDTVPKKALELNERAFELGWKCFC
jgi:2-oxoglutarate ferredoxin oxidoreductase subunit gamma